MFTTTIRFLAIVAILTLSLPVYADVTSGVTGGGFTNVQTEDGTTSCFGFQIKVTNGDLTDNADSTCSIDTSGSATGDITSVGDVSSGAAFDGTQGTTLTFNDALGDQTLSFDGANFRFSDGLRVDGALIFDLVSGQYLIGTQGNGTLVFQDANSDSASITLDASTNDFVLTLSVANQAFRPDGDNADDLGLSAQSWRNLFVDTAIFTNLLDADGAVDLDIGSTDVTDVKVTTDDGDVILDGSISTSRGSTAAGLLIILEDTDAGTNNATFTVPALAADTDYTWPPDDGDSGEFLRTDGVGVLTWVASSGSGDITSVGDVASGAAFDGTQGTILTFNNASGDQTFQFDDTTQDFLLSDDLTIADTSPFAELCDETDNVAFMWHLDTAEVPSGSTFWRGTNTSCTGGFNRATTYPALLFDTSDILTINNGVLINPNALTTGDFNIASFEEPNMFIVDYSENTVGIGTALPDFHLDIHHTADDAGDIGMHLEHDVNSNAGTVAFQIDLVATLLGAEEEATGVVLNMNTADSLGGEMDAFTAVVVGTGSAEPHALRVGPGIEVIEHSSGTLGNVGFCEIFDDSLSSFTDCVTAANSAGTDVDIFVEQDDFLYIGNSAKFSTISFDLAIGAGPPGIKPTFEHSITGDLFTTFGPLDTTKGMRESGVVLIDLDVISGDWVTATVDGDSAFWIRIKRTRNTISPVPTENLIQSSATSEFEWDKNGNLTVNQVGIGIAPSELLTVYRDSSGTTSPQVVIEDDGTGDAVLAFQLTGASGFSMGIDNTTTNDDFVISDVIGQLGTNNRFVIDGSSGNITIAQNLTTGEDLTVTGAGPNISLNPTSGDTFGFHVDPTISVAFINNETDGVHYLTFQGDHDIIIGHPSVPQIILKTTGTGDDVVVLPFDSIGNTEVSFTMSRPPVIENLAAADDNIPIGPGMNVAITVTAVGCKCHGTCTTPAQISLEDDSGNAMTHNTLTCATSPTVMTFIPVTAANVIVAGESIRFDVDNAVSPETDRYEISYIYTF